MKNPNHPKKGDKILVHPIQNVKDIQAIKTLLSDRPRGIRSQGFRKSLYLPIRKS